MTIWSTIFFSFRLDFYNNYKNILFVFVRWPQSVVKSSRHSKVKSRLFVSYSQVQDLVVKLRVTQCYLASGLEKGCRDPGWTHENPVFLFSSIFCWKKCIFSSVFFFLPNFSTSIFIINNKYFSIPSAHKFSAELARGSRCCRGWTLCNVDLPSVADCTLGSNSLSRTF